MKKIIQIFIQITIIIGLFYHFVNSDYSLEHLYLLNFTKILIITLLIFLGNILRSAQLQSFTEALGDKISYLNAFCITVGGTLVNYLPLNAGIFVKASALKKLNIKYAHFISIYSVEILVTAISSSFFCLISLIFSPFNYNINTDKLFIFLGCIFICSIIGLMAKSAWIQSWEGKVLSIVKNFIIGIEQIVQRKKILLLIFYFVNLRLLIIALVTYVCFLSLGADLSLVGSIFVATATSLLMVINITPGGIGIREVVLGLISSTTGGEFELGVLASLIMRGCSMMVHLLFGIPSLLYLKKSKIF